MRRSRSFRVLVVMLALAGSMLALVGAGSALAQPPNRVKVLIGFTQQPGPPEQALVHRAGGTIKYTYHLVPAIAATVPETAINGLRRNPNVTHVELDGRVYAVGQVLPWGIERIDAEAVHAVGNKGTGVMVAILDTGTDKDHPDLVANIKGGINFAAGPKGRWDDSDGHGTHVAGTIAAVDNDFGVVGVAPEAHLYAVRVLGRGGGSYSDVIAGIEWAVDHGIQVTNNSYGSTGDPGAIVEAAFDEAYAAGILNVCAAGNEGAGDNTVIYPARFESCIAVAATDSNDNRASFSSTGPDLELVAPGVSIYSTFWNDTYDTLNGTSMACPHVAGTAALVLAAYPGSSNDEVRLRLQDTAEDIGLTAYQQGSGLVDADEAAADTTPPEPTHDVAVSSISVPSTVGQGDIVGVDVTVANEGTCDETFTLTLTDKDEAEVVVNIGSETVSLAAGAFTTIAFDWDTTDSSLGDHLLKAEASVVDGETDTEDNVKTATVTVSEAGATMHVDSLDMVLKTAGINTSARATANVVDANGAPIEGATLSGNWEDATNDSDSGATDANGQVVLESDKVRRAESETTFTFVIANVAKGGWTYDSSANGDLDGDGDIGDTSNSITVP